MSYDDTPEQPRGWIPRNPVSRAPAAPAAPPAPPERRPVEAWAKDLAVPGWLFAAAKQKRRWPQGRETTKADFEAALSAALHERIG